jgi:PIN domain nuclease of toxin-antitoxin system
VTLLLDTCTFLWVTTAHPRLSPRAAALIADPANDVHLSAVTVWEIVTKHGRGRLPLPLPPDQFVPMQRERRGFRALPMDENAVLQGIRLPALHRDPFDRMLIAQAIAHGLAILTPDPLVTQYPVRVLW